MKKRWQKAVIIIFLSFAAGLAYGLFYIKTGMGIPCIFHEITGLSCPGCGITHMFIFLMQGDVLRAMESNHMVFFLLPVLLLLLGDYVLRYVRTGIWEMRRWQTIVLYIMIGMLGIYGVGRNVGYAVLLK